MKTLANERDASELLRRLQTLRPDAERRWGRMSAHQMVCHLGDSFRMALGQRQVSDATTCVGRTVVKWIALYAPLRWPPGIMTRPEVDQEFGGTCPQTFAGDLAQAQQLLRDTVNARGRGRWPRHPIFGPMSERAWLRWGYLHTEHHLRQFGQ